jgi:hypothetical protein
MPNSNSGRDVVYVDFTNSSVRVGSVETSAAPDSLATITKNAFLVTDQIVLLTPPALEPRQD